MVQEGIMLGHKISKKGIEVDKAKLDVIYKIPPPVNMKGIRSFLGHAGFYRRFIKDFSKIAKPLSNLLNKEAVFVFNDECLEAFNTLKAKLVSAPVITSPDFGQEFELMCDASDYAVGVVLEQRKGRIFHTIYYASKVLNDAQINYATTEKELLAKRFFYDARHYVWDDPHLFKIGADNLLRRYVTNEEAKGILWHCHNSPCGGHYGGSKTAARVLQLGFLWPTIFKDAHHHVLK